MNNEKKTKIEADSTIRCYVDESSNEERIQLLNSIVEACLNDDRAKCYEQIIEYSRNEPFLIHFDVFNAEKHHLFISQFGPCELLISEDYSMEDIIAYMNILTDLYEIGFFCLDKKAIACACDNKENALITIERVFSIMKKHTNPLDFDTDGWELSSETFIFGDDENMPKWINKMWKNPALQQWRKQALGID